MVAGLLREASSVEALRQALPREPHCHRVTVDER